MSNGSRVVDGIRVAENVALVVLPRCGNCKLLAPKCTCGVSKLNR